MKSWWFSLALLGGYVLTFLLWNALSDRSAFLVIGFLAVVAMAAGLSQAARHRYFVNRSDFVLHALVIVDVALEGLSYEAFHAAARCLLCVPGDAGTFHDNFNFCWCAAILGLLVGGYHAWALRSARLASDRPAGADGPPPTSNEAAPV